ncbi:MAG: S8 family serine peptidase [Bacteroidales bacterium]|nr:S8 family serine peptidase [Bacteroidales bacterium]
MEINYKYFSTFYKVFIIALTLSATTFLNAQEPATQGKPNQLNRTLAGGDQKLSEDSQVSDAAPYEPQDIVDALAPNAVTLQDMELRAKHHPYMPGEIVIAMELGTSKSNAASVLDQFNWQGLFAQQGVELSSVLMKADRGSFRSIALVLLSLPEGIEVFTAMKKLEGKSGVLWSSPNFYFEGDPREFSPNDPDYAAQYHHPLMKNDLAWDITLGSPSIVVGITDDGVELTHSDLATNIWVNTGEIPGNGIDDDGNGYIDDVNGWDFSSGNNNPNPNLLSDTHGTHVAGITAARTNNSIGIAGVAGNSAIMPLQFYAGGPWTAAIINETFTYAADNGAKIVNTSYNIDGWVGDPVFTAGLQYLYDAGVLHLNSAGNNNQLNPPRQAFQQTLLVASTDAADVRSSFSNYGTGIDISAPGSSILSTVTGNSYNFLSGTSMATPNAAGTAALIWSANPSWTRDQVAAQLLATADNIDAANPTLVGLLGSGRVNSYAALTTLLAAPQVKSTPGLPDEGTIIFANHLTSFSVAFDQVMNPASVNNLANFELRNAGPNEIFGDGDDLVHPLTTTTNYQIGSNQLIFQISDLPLQCGLHRLKLVSGGLENPFGTELDGDGNGTGGDDYVRNFAVVDVLTYFDGDGDGYGAGSPSTACPPPPGYVLLDGDCDDNDPLIYPGATEVCDGVDNNCDGIVDFPPAANYVSSDVPVAIPTSGTPTVTSALTISGATGNIIDLNVTDLNILHTYVGDLKVTLTSPGGTVLVLFDRPGHPVSTYGCSQNNIFTTFDDEASLTAVDFENTCNSSATTTPPHTYTISGIYQPIDALSALNGTNPDGTWTLTVSDFFDGDGGSIEGWGLEISVPDVTNTYYADADGDGYGDPNVSIELACTPDPLLGWVLDNSDCDDTNPDINPAATEVCDGMDNNCDGIVDFPSVDTYASSDVPVAIPTSGTPTVTSTLTISGATGNIIDLNVKDLNILHTWVGDLKVTLTSPGGTVLVLFDRPGYPATTFGCEQNNIFTTFDDEASLTAVDFENTCNSSPGTTPPYTYAISGIYQPIDALSALNGTSPDGTWTLTVSDFFDGDGGSIEGWGLEIISVPGIIFVDAGATGLNNGSSWTDAFTDLQDALNSTCPGITGIWVADGTYYPTSVTTDREATFQLISGVAIYGGFNGTESMLSERDWITNSTILSGDIDGDGTLTGNSYTVVTGSGTEATAVIDGFTITGGNSNGSGGDTSHFSGGGIYSSNGSPTVTNCTFTWNSVSSTGGAFFIENGNSILRNNTFISNHADFSGGAIRYEGGEHIAVNNLFAHNTTNLFGSVIGTATTDYTLINNTFVNNEASDIGTVVYNFSSNVDLVNNIFWGNTKGGETDVPDADLINDIGIVNRFEYSLLQANSAYSGNAGNITNVDPLFIDQPPVGIYTGGDLRLQACSPAINAGSNAAVPAGIITDLDGTPRFYDNGTVDMGAYEYQGEKNVNPPPIAIISGIIDDFEAASLPNGTDPFGNGIGFITFGDFGAGTTVDIATTLVADTDPLAMPGQSGDNYLLRFEANVNDFGGLTHAFENEDVNTWVTQDWSGNEGIAFWLYGQNTGNSLYFEIQDNRNPGSTIFDVELWTYAFTDDFSGWKLFVLSFDDFTRKEIGNGAPNDGFGRDEVHGWVFGALNTGGETVTYYLDNVMVYGDGGPFCPYTTINFSAPAGMATYAWSLSVISGDASIGSWDNNIFTPETDNEQDVQVVGVCGTVFTLTLTVTDAQGCTASAQNSFVVEESGLEWVNEPQDYSLDFNMDDLEAEVQNWLNSMEASSSCSTLNASYFLPLLQVNSPGDIQENYISGRANFGPLEFNVTGDLEMADPALACDPLLNDLTNKIAIIDRGICTFTSKVKNAQDAGAIAAIVINSNPEQGVITMGGTDPSITIPSLFISYEDGLVLKTAMQQGLVNATLSHFIDLQPGDYPVLFRATTQCQLIEKTVTLHIEVTPVNLDLNGLVIGENDSECFGATQNITVQDVTVNAGGSLTLIAGNSIIITPGFIVAANAYFHAYISDEYCLLPASLLALETEVENNPALDFNENLSDDLRIFPNPTTGGFTIEMGETFGSNKTSVSIYNLIGELILTNENVLNQAEFNLSGHPNGIYVVLIRNNENTEIRKLIKQ